MQLEVYFSVDEDVQFFHEALTWNAQYVITLTLKCCVYSVKQNRIEATSMRVSQ